MTWFSFNFLALFSLLTLRFACSAPILSCSQTPYPQVCKDLISENYTQFSQSKTVSGFRNLAIQMTMDRVALTHQLASSIDLTVLDNSVRAAWADCLVLCQDTINQLNRTITESSTHEDSQTWLSAAIANHETCKNGFIELNASYHMPSSPFMKYNISESISNSLAINKAMAPSSSTGNRKLLSDGFPAWVSAADRKLLQSSTVKANLVVAQDGSGNYKTISEAVAASANQRSGNSRFVIHVKAGTYNEDVQIKASNLMLIGDGIDVTVVTGSKNVVDGTTTFNSATVGKTNMEFEDLLVDMDALRNKTADELKKHKRSASRPPPSQAPLPPALNVLTKLVSRALPDVGAKGSSLAAIMASFAPVPLIAQAAAILTDEKEMVHILDWSVK